MEVGTSWVPGVGTAKILAPTPQDSLGGLGMIFRCQNICRETPGCAYFTLHLATRECHLANAAATPMRGISNTIGGPPQCEDRIFAQKSMLAKMGRDNGTWATSSSAL